MKTNGLDPSDRISIHTFPATFTQAYDSKGTHEGANTGCVRHFITNSTAALLASWLYMITVFGQTGGHFIFLEGSVESYPGYVCYWLRYYQNGNKDVELWSAIKHDANPVFWSPIDEGFEMQASVYGIKFQGHLRGGIVGLHLQQFVVSLEHQ